MRCQTKQFKDLTTRELYEIYKLRSIVFVVEQNCPYQDVDDKDLECYHVLMTDNENLIGYSRIIPPGKTYKNPRIGRVVLDIEKRGSGLGKELMKYSINKALKISKDEDVIISAQVYLKNFYTSLGFTTEGEHYLEDNIPHVKMRYRVSANH